MFYFRNFKGFADVTLNLERPVTILIGPNGSGKTTLIKILTGLSKPSEGKAFVAGFDTISESIKVKENIGWISSEVILDEKYSDSGSVT